MLKSVTFNHVYRSNFIVQLKLKRSLYRHMTIEFERFDSHMTIILSATQQKLLLYRHMTIEFERF